MSQCLIFARVLNSGHFWRYVIVVWFKLTIVKMSIYNFTWQNLNLLYKKPYIPHLCISLTVSLPGDRPSQPGVCRNTEAGRIQGQYYHSHHGEAPAFWQTKAQQGIDIHTSGTSACYQLYSAMQKLIKQCFIYLVKLLVSNSQSDYWYSLSFILIASIITNCTRWPISAYHKDAKVQVMQANIQICVPLQREPD